MCNLFVSEHNGGQLLDAFNAKGHVLERHFAVGAVDFAVVGKALPSFSVKFSTVVSRFALKNFYLMLFCKDWLLLNLVLYFNSARRLLFKTSFI